MFHPLVYKQMQSQILNSSTNKCSVGNPEIVSQYWKRSWAFYLVWVLSPNPRVENVTAQSFKHAVRTSDHQQDISFLPLEVSSWVPLFPIYVSSSPLLLSEHPSSPSAACHPSGFCGSFCALCGPLHLFRRHLPLHSVEMNIKFNSLIFSP